MLFINNRIRTFHVIKKVKFECILSKLLYIVPMALTYKHSFNNFMRLKKYRNGKQKHFLTIHGMTNIPENYN